jgi:hypothetical protein
MTRPDANQPIILPEATPEERAEARERMRQRYAEALAKHPERMAKLRERFPQIFNANAA